MHDAMKKQVGTRETWVLGLKEIWERLVTVLRFKAALYVTTFVWFFGGMGVWLAAIMNQNGGAAPRDLYLSVLTFSLAVSVSGAFDGTLSPATTGPIGSMND